MVKRRTHLHGQGTALSVVLLGFMKGRTLEGDELYAFITAIELIDLYIIVPTGVGTLLTGLLFCSLTKWGFFKFFWIKVKLSLMIGQTLFGTFFLGEWIKQARAIADAQRGLALQNQEYLHFMDMYNYGGSIQALLLIVTIFISVFKPWGVKK